MVLVFDGSSECVAHVCTETNLIWFVYIDSNRLNWFLSVLLHTCVTFTDLPTKPILYDFLRIEYCLECYENDLRGYLLP